MCGGGGGGIVVFLSHGYDLDLENLQIQKGYYRGVRS